MMPPTYFQRPDRSDPQAVSAEAELLKAQPILQPVLRAIGVPAAVLNADRQIVAASPALAEICGTTVDELRGWRLGEALGCLHAIEPPAGCGTTPACCACGAAQTIQAVWHTRENNSAECRILRADGEALTMRANGGPLVTDAGVFTIITFQDISDTKRRDALERLFFHDVLNAAGALKGLVDAWPDLSRGDVVELAGHAQELASQLVEEITAQRDLRLAESGALPTPLEPVSLPTLVEGIVRVFGKHRLAYGRILRAEHHTSGVIVTTPVLLRRVLGNLVLNALEATAPGGTVTVHTEIRDHVPVISVHNPGVMPRNIELQIFQRGFTTSGRQGRGLGTYSVKLLTERYLHGRVSFRTSDEEGTTFQVELPAVS